jgi:hypothetical protein
MSTGATSNVDRKIPGGFASDVGEIHSVPAQNTAQSVVRENLLPEEEAVSLQRQAATTATQPIAPLNRYLGPSLTVANPVWSGDPVPRMRGLQKTLVEHSLSLEESDRSECMGAIQVVETAVQLRLRFQQMRISLAEMDGKPESETAQ